MTNIKFGKIKQTKLNINKINDKQLILLPVSVLKVCVVVERKFSDRLWISFSLALAKLNNKEGRFILLFIYITEAR